NAVLDGTDAVMLSNETASGKYPLESVRMMKSIVAATETREPDTLRRREDRDKNAGMSEAVVYAGCRVASYLDAKAIVAFTESGKTAITTARQRGTRPIYAFSAHQRTCNLLNIVWGVRASVLRAVDATD